MSKKVEIFENALKLMSKSGIEQVSFQKIADTMGLSQQAIIRYFGNRKQFLVELYEHVFLEINDQVQNEFLHEDNAYVRIFKRIHQQLEIARKRPIMAQLVIHVYYQSSCDPFFRELNKEILDKSRSLYLDYFHAGEREKLFKFKIPKNVAAEILHEYFLGAFVYTQSTGSSLKEIIPRLQSLVFSLTGYTQKLKLS